MEWGPQAEQTALLTGPGYTGQARGGGENMQKEEPEGWGLSLSAHLLGQHALMP